MHGAIIVILSRPRCSVQRMESKELDNGEKRSYLCHYYYINYKVFVNVVKYKLDRMRERIQAEERTVSFYYIH